MASSNDGLLSTAKALVFAGFALIFGTLMHQSSVEPGIPIGLMFSLGLVLMLAANIRDGQKSKTPGFVFAITVGIGMIFLSQNPTSDILIPGNEAGLWWSYGGMAIAALVALWPKLRSQQAT